MVYKSLNGLTPSYLIHSAEWYDYFLQFAYYSENKLAIPLPRTNYYKKALATVVQSSGTVCPQLWARQHLWLIFDNCWLNSDTAFMKNRS